MGEGCDVVCLGVSLRGNGGRVRCGMIGISLAGKWGKGAMWYDWDFPCGEMGEGCDVVCLGFPLRGNGGRVRCGMIGIFLETVSRGLKMGPARRSLLQFHPFGADLSVY